MSLDLSAPAFAENIQTAAETREAAVRSTPDSRQMRDRHGGWQSWGSTQQHKDCRYIRRRLKI